MVAIRVVGDRSPRGYDRLAPWYRVLEFAAFGAELQRARTALLPHLHSCDRLLVMGDGDGRLLQALLALHADCRVTSVEQSRRMIDLQRQRVQRIEALQRVTWVEADAATYLPRQGSFDAVVTAFFLDCFSPGELEMLMPRLRAGLTASGCWYFVDFQVPPQGLRRLRAELLLAGLHRFFRWQTGLPNRRLVDLGPGFARLGMQLVERSDRSHGLLSSRIYRGVGERHAFRSPLQSL